MSAIEVVRVSDDGLSGEDWTFSLSANGWDNLVLLRLQRYQRWAKPTRRHKPVINGLYDSMDRRAYHTTVPVPPLPPEIIDEAKAKIIVRLA